MRRILIASLLLSPALFTAAAVASQPATDAAAQPQNLRVSTGVIAPTVLYSVPVSMPFNESPHASHSTVVLSLQVDEAGKPSNIQVVNPVSPVLDEHLVDAVSKYRFQPATLDNQAIPVKMTLTVDVNE